MKAGLFSILILCSTCAFSQEQIDMEENIFVDPAEAIVHRFDSLVRILPEYRKLEQNTRNCTVSSTTTFPKKCLGNCNDKTHEVIKSTVGLLCSPACAGMIPIYEIRYSIKKKSILSIIELKDYFVLLKDH